MNRVFSVVAILAFVLLPSVASAAPTNATDNCQYVLGFKALHDQEPNVVGDCLTNQYYNGQTGDGVQQTTRGLLVWRKADNSIAFTNGYQTWVNGPNGVQTRLNSQRFPWEHDSNTAQPGQLVPAGPMSGAFGNSPQTQNQNYGANPQTLGAPRSGASFGPVPSGTGSPMSGPFGGSNQTAGYNGSATSGYSGGMMHH